MFMKTSKEMQVKILKKIASNVENGKPFCDNIQYWSLVGECWVDIESFNMKDLNNFKIRIKPETITINGVDVPKPLDIIEIDINEDYYFPQCREKMYGVLKGNNVLEYNVFLPYKTKEEAIKAAKLIFDMEDE